MTYAYEWLAALDRGELSSRELTQQYLQRIEAVNGRINAVVAMEPEKALADADKADRSRAKGDRRPLLGLPVTIKDSIEVEGMVSAGGSFAREGYRPKRDAPVVKRLRGAGAIILAKTNCAERSASYETDNVIYGRTNNPIDTERTPGGSSGGEAALSAADATPLGLGADGGGSIRVPAHFCGVVGLRPTVGRVPETGLWPSTRASGYMDLVCVGPIARCVEDVALGFEAIIGPDAEDPYSVPVALRDYREMETRELRVGYFIDLPGVPITPGTVETMRNTIELLARVGMQIREIQPPLEPNATELFFQMIWADGGELVRSDVAGANGKHVRLFQEYLDVQRNYALDAAGWFRVQRQFHDLRARIRRLMEEVDVIVCPVAGGPASKHGMPPADLPEDEYASSRAFDYVNLLSIGGLPSASVPAGQEGGLPIGVQISAAPFREDIVLAVASVVEKNR